MTCEEISAWKPAEVTVVLAEDHCDFYRDILPRVEELVKMAQEQRIIVEDPECHKPSQSIIISYKGTPVEIIRRYDIVTHHYLVRLSLVGHKEERDALDGASTEAL